MSSPVQILSTKMLSPVLTEEAMQAGIEVHSVPFITTETIDDIFTREEVEQVALLTGTVVFTSTKAVEAVGAMVDKDIIQWDIYCIGHATKEAAEKYFGEGNIRGTADNATELAGLLVEESPGENIIFFCGNRRRDELPDILESEGIPVNDIVVYETVATPRKILKYYNGILFFSPSAVESFFSINTVTENSILFAIGNTTASALKKYTSNKIIIAKTAERPFQNKDGLRSMSGTVEGFRKFLLG